MLIGSDGHTAMMRPVLSRAGLATAPCRGLAHLLDELDQGAGAVLMGGEALGGCDLGALIQWIDGQPSWSDLSFLLLVRQGAMAAQPTQEHYMLQASTNLIVLERPVSNPTLVGALRSALRARARQYEVRDGLQALSASEAQNRTLIEALPHLVWTCEPDGTCDYLSRQHLEFTGLSETTQWLEEVVHADDRNQTLQQWAQAVSTGAGWDIEHRLRRKDGSYLWFKTRALAMRDEAGTIIKWFGTSTEISDIVEARQNLALSRAELERLVEERTRTLAETNARLKAEIEEREEAQAQLRQAHKLEAVGQLTSGVAHDFNNLLTAILGNLEMAQRLAGEERVQRLLAAAKRAAERGAVLTQHLLAFGRKQHLAPRPVRLNEMMEKVQRLLVSTMAPSIRIETELVPDLPPAHVDPMQIELVLVHLAINARDAMQEGGRLTLVAFEPRPDSLPVELKQGRYVAVAVSDTGVGMTEDVLSKALDPFFTTKPLGQGSGLGLSMVHGVAVQSGGNLTIETKAGQGTTVTVFLPVAGESASPLDQLP
jgi:PAS domain S-box-containing protein